MTVELIRILSDAESELHEGRAFYASQGLRITHKSEIINKFSYMAFY